MIKADREIAHNNGSFAVAMATGSLSETGPRRFGARRSFNHQIECAFFNENISARVLQKTNQLIGGKDRISYLMGTIEECVKTK